MAIKTLDLAKLNSKDPKEKFGFAKELLIIGKNDPEQLYPYFDRWERLLEENNNVLRWTGIDILGFLASVDSENRVDPKIVEIIDFYRSGHLVTSNHAIFAMGLIAKHKPKHRDWLLNELLSIREMSYDTEDCLDIATGKVLLTLMDFSEDLKGNPKAMGLIQSARNCNWNATQKKAEVLFKKIKKA